MHSAASTETVESIVKIRVRELVRSALLGAFGLQDEFHVGVHEACYVQ